MTTRTPEGLTTDRRWAPRTLRTSSPTTARTRSSSCRRRSTAARTGPGRSSPSCSATYRRRSGSSRRSSPSDVLYVEWKATGGGSKIEDGIDTFIFQDGMIRVQTVVYTVQPA